MSDWRFELANSLDLSRIGELQPAKNRSLTMTLNRGGEFTFTVALESPIAYEIEEIKTCVLIWRRGTNNEFKIVWSGPVWGIEITTPNTMNITCVGWIQTLEKRILPIDLGELTADAGSIVLALLNQFNSISADSGAPVYVTSGDVIPTVTRTRSYKKYEDFLNIIHNLSDIESGFDFVVDPVLRTLNIYDMYGEIKSNLRFEYKININAVTRSSDSSRICNQFTAVGAANTIPQQANNSESQSQYGIFAELATVSDVKSNTILAAYADSEVAVRAFPLRIYSFSTRQAGTGSTTPRAFQDFFIGDIGYLTVNKGPVIVKDQAVRIFSFTLSFDDNGNELPAQIQTTDQ